MSDLDALTASLEELRAIGPAVLELRVRVLDQRAELEDKLPTLALAHDIDDSVAMRVLAEAWRVHVAELMHEDQVQAFARHVEDDMSVVFKCLATGAVPDTVRESKILENVVASGSRDEPVVTVRSVARGG